MIQVQIAATVLEDGVADNRWVLVDDGDAPPLANPPSDAGAAAAPSAGPSPPASAAAGSAGAGIFLLARVLLLAGALGGAWALSLAILQARTPAGAAVDQALDPARPQATASPREAAEQAVARRAPDAGVAATAPPKRSTP